MSIIENKYQNNANKHKSMNSGYWWKANSSYKGAFTGPKGIKYFITEARHWVISFLWEQHLLIGNQNQHIEVHYNSPNPIKENESWIWKVTILRNKLNERPSHHLCLTVSQKATRLFWLRWNHLSPLNK